MKNSINAVWIYARSCDRRPDVLPPLMREAKRRNYRVAGISIDPYRRYPGHGLKLAMNAIKSGYASAILTPYLSAISSNPKVIRKVLTALQDSGAVIITTESDICFELAFLGLKNYFIQRALKYDTSLPWREVILT